MMAVSSFVGVHASEVTPAPMGSALVSPAELSFGLKTGNAPLSATDLGGRQHDSLARVEAAGKAFSRADFLFHHDLKVFNDEKTRAQNAEEELRRREDYLKVFEDTHGGTLREVRKDLKRHEVRGFERAQDKVNAARSRLNRVQSGVDEVLNQKWTDLLESARDRQLKANAFAHATREHQKLLEAANGIVPNVRPLTQVRKAATLNRAQALEKSVEVRDSFEHAVRLLENAQPLDRDQAIAAAETARADYAKAVHDYDAANSMLASARSAERQALHDFRNATASHDAFSSFDLKLKVDGFKQDRQNEYKLAGQRVEKAREVHKQVQAELHALQSLLQASPSDAVESHNKVMANAEAALAEANDKLIQAQEELVVHEKKMATLDADAEALAKSSDAASRAEWLAKKAEAEHIADALEKAEAAERAEEEAIKKADEEVVKEADETIKKAKAAEQAKESEQPQESEQAGEAVKKIDEALARAERFKDLLATDPSARAVTTLQAALPGVVLGVSDAMIETAMRASLQSSLSQDDAIWGRISGHTDQPTTKTSVKLPTGGLSMDARLSNNMTTAQFGLSVYTNERTRVDATLGFGVSGTRLAGARKRDPELTTSSGSVGAIIQHRAPQDIDLRLGVQLSGGSSELKGGGIGAFGRNFERKFQHLGLGMRAEASRDFAFGQRVVITPLAGLGVSSAWVKQRGESFVANQAASAWVSTRIAYNHAMQSGRRASYWVEPTYVSQLKRSTKSTVAFEDTQYDVNFRLPRDRMGVRMGVEVPVGKQAFFEASVSRFWGVGSSSQKQGNAQLGYTHRF